MQPNVLASAIKRIGIRAPVTVEPVADEPPPLPLWPGIPAKVPRRQPLQRSDFTDHGFTTGCPECNIIASGRPEEALHNQACKRRMEPLFLQSDAGRKRVE